MNREIEKLTNEFTTHLVRTIDEHIQTEISRRALAAFGGSPGRGSPRGAFKLEGGKLRRKMPVQLCPVPGCKNKAAPVFGMVCRDHTGIAKKTIAKYREARRAKKGN